MMSELLVAIRPEDFQLMSDALGGEFDFRVCHTLSDAKMILASPLNRQIDAIICGLHFDDGNMFELLKYAKGYPDTEAIPFFCIKGAGGELTPAIFHAIVIATEKMGGDAFIDMSDLSRKFGEKNTYSILREGLREILSKRPQRP